ncbi:uncharacterized protein LOC131624167 [Vicia villosa]|uniref:uncharacterized protein LOC131624167 n=1 Tax=Vicia villosa TaxID=3911 RepID=UPI00273B9680|nr:uncharacterized protein LOC131624167 [Vicia villosa]
MRLQQGSDNTSSKELAEFSKWILNVGDGKILEPNDGLVDIEIPQELLITNFEDPIKVIVESTYPNLVNVFQDVAYLQGKEILASTIEVVDKINHYVLDLIPGEEKEYLSYDSIDRTDTNHGQLYVAISIVTTKSGLKILIHDKENVPCSTTTNVVYKKVFFVR